jgi:hypothetical protein
MASLGVKCTTEYVMTTPTLQLIAEKVFKVGTEDFVELECRHYKTHKLLGGKNYSAQVMTTAKEYQTIQKNASIEKVGQILSREGSRYVVRKQQDRVRKAAEMYSLENEGALVSCSLPPIVDGTGNTILDTTNIMLPFDIAPCKLVIPKDGGQTLRWLFTQCKKTRLDTVTNCAHAGSSAASNDEDGHGDTHADVSASASAEVPADSNA